MKNNTLLFSLLLLAGCATEPALTIKFDSNPQGAWVYVKNKTRGGRLGLEPLRGEMGVIPEWDPIGTTPFKRSWTLPISDPEVSPLTFKALLPDGTKGPYTKYEVCDPNLARRKGKNSTCVIFFDLTNR